MATGTWYAQRCARAATAGEIGAIRKDAAHRLALVYPSPYRAAMSSLGYQTIYRVINALPDWVAERAVLPDDVAAHRAAAAPLITLEREAAVGDYPLLAFSVAYELEIAGLIDCLELSGLSPLAAERPATAPLVVAGGPLTFSNPVPLGPFCDVILVGEAEETLPAFLDMCRELGYRRREIMEAAAGRPGFYVPSIHGDRCPPVAAASDALLPARSQILTENTELSGMFLTEAARGCSRGCTYCVMRRSTNGGMRIVPVETILAGIPAQARRVGLVGAAVTDHPRIVEVVRGVVERGCEVGISSLRADKLTDELVGLLARGGYRTLTVAGDGASEALRRSIERRTTNQHLLRTAELARKHGLRTVKIYMMLGLPGETDADIDELGQLAAELVRIHPRIAFGVAPFVAKRNTPLDGEPFAGIPLVEARLGRMRRALGGNAQLRPTSARWAWVEYMLAQGRQNAGLAVLDAHRAGGRFADYRKAFAARGCVPTGPVARVPSTAELIALRRRGADRSDAPALTGS
jgi:radical SAM superfamily enzyme YgiQ (UPF0313 family)